MPEPAPVMAATRSSKCFTTLTSDPGRTAGQLERLVLERRSASAIRQSRR